MRKLILTCLFALFFCIGAFATKEPTVYVSVFGNDQNPGTVDAPLKTLEAGFHALPLGGKIVLQTAFSLKETTNEFPETDGLITLTSYDGVTDYRQLYHAKLYLVGQLMLRGDMKFENIDFVACDTDRVIICNGHYTCFGEGINCSTMSKDINLIGITGGGNRRYPAKNSAIEIHSGDWFRIRGGQRNSDLESFNGNISIAIYGGTFHEMVWLSGDIFTNGNAKLFIFGGNFKSTVRLANTHGFSGDVDLSIYGGNFEKEINISNGGTIHGNVTVTAFAKTNARIVNTKGTIEGNIRIETTNPINIKSSFDTYILSSQKAEEKKAEDAEFIKSTFVCDHQRYTPVTDYVGKVLTDGELLCDVDASGYVSLFDALTLSLSQKCDIKPLLTAISKSHDETYSLYGASFEKDILHGGYAFTNAAADSYKVGSSVTLSESGVVSLFFGCDKNPPESLNGYCFEADLSREVLCAYEIKNGSYRYLGKKPLDLLSSEAEIYVEYSNSVANLYFDDNKFEEEQFFEFNFELKKYGNEVGIYVRNASATLPKCEEFTIDDSKDTYTNELLYSFTDPDIFCENGVYYIYGSGNGNGEGITGSGINCFSTTDFEKFKYEGQVLKKRRYLRGKRFSLCEYSKVRRLLLYVLFRLQRGVRTFSDCMCIINIADRAVYESRDETSDKYPRYVGRSAVCR